MKKDDSKELCICLMLNPQSSNKSPLENKLEIKHSIEMWYKSNSLQRFQSLWRLHHRLHACSDLFWEVLVKYWIYSYVSTLRHAASNI